MGAQLQHVAVLDRPGLALVRVHDDVARAGLARDRLPLDPGREAGAPVAREARRLQLLDDALGRRELAVELETAARDVVVERVVALREPHDRAVVRRVRDLGDDLVAARQHGREVAVAEAGDLDRARVLREQLARAEAVADRAGADADGVDRHLEERVERDDLVHLAAADVHVVGERVGELRRDRRRPRAGRGRGCRAAACARSAAREGARPASPRPCRDPTPGDGVRSWC